MWSIDVAALFGRNLSQFASFRAPTCGNGPALEHNGDLYSCDHFVEPDYLLGSIHKTHMLELLALPQQRKFGMDKDQDGDDLWATLGPRKGPHLRSRDRNR